ncbi:MAG TPA: nitrogenase reductase, partial [Nitrospirae bacterium]|nr:nitrogenase reductase [Nitrospirota bacterium]
LAKAIDENEQFVIPTPIEIEELEKLLMAFGLMEVA